MHPKGTITADGARLDIVATGLYGNNEKTFMGSRMVHAYATSKLSIPIDKLLLQNEAEKKSRHASTLNELHRLGF